jgi:hypothetical protein
VDGGHLLDQIPCDVADSVQLDVARLAASLEVGELGDRSAAEDSHPQVPWLFFQAATPLFLQAPIEVVEPGFRYQFRRQRDGTHGCIQAIEWSRGSSLSENAEKIDPRGFIVI